MAIATTTIAKKLSLTFTEQQSALIAEILVELHEEVVKYGKR